MRVLLIGLLILSCYKVKEPLNVDMYVVKDGDGYRVVGFVDGEYLREHAYISALMLPTRLSIKVGNKEFPIYADILSLTLDKQRSINRAFLVSERFNYDGEKDFVIEVYKGSFKVGKIYGNLKPINPHYDITGIEKVYKDGRYYVYVKVKAYPALRNYPKLIMMNSEEIDTLIPVEIAPFKTEYTGRFWHKYQAWYDEWIFVGRFVSLPNLKGVKWFIDGKFFGDRL